MILAILAILLIAILIIRCQLSVAVVVVRRVLRLAGDVNAMFFMSNSVMMLI